VTGPQVDEATRDSRAEDRALLAAHVAGDPDAFGELVRRHRDRLWAVALRTTGDREDAADALQEALVSAYRAAASYRGEAAVTTWLHRIVVNACLDALRRRTARRSVPLSDEDVRLADPTDVLGDRETSLVVAQALDTLPPDQRAAIVLVDLQGHSVDEAARILDCATGTVKSRCSRGRARLAPLLRPMYGGVTKTTVDAGSPTPSGGNATAPPSVTPLRTDDTGSAPAPAGPDAEPAEGGEQ
jgi:RNA polymerase sigma-70 factor, ECF subfamily